MRERGAGRGTMSAGTGPVLDAPTAALVRVAAAVARGNGPELKARFAAARDARVPGPVPVTAEQVHSHWRGALNTGAAAAGIGAVLGAIDGDLDAEQRGTARKQWEDVKKRKL